MKLIRYNLYENNIPLLIRHFSRTLVFLFPGRALYPLILLISRIFAWLARITRLHLVGYWPLTRDSNAIILRGIASYRDAP